MIYKRALFRRSVALTILMTIGITLFSCEKKKSDNIFQINSRVVDNVDLLKEYEEKALLMEIEKIEQELGPQIGLALVDTLNGETIEKFSLRVAETMKLGRPEFSDGLLIVFASGDRKVRIEVGEGLEKIIRDEIAARIIKERLAPNLKNKRYFDAFSSSIADIKLEIENNKNLIGQKP